MTADRDFRTRLRGDLGLGMWLDFRPGPNERATPQLYGECLDLAAHAGELGYSAIFSSEHHGAPGDYLPTPLLTLAAIAARTSVALVAPGVMLAPMWPKRIAVEELTTLDLVSNGRAIAGLAVGYADFDFDALGVDRRRRGAMLDELLDELELAWSGHSDVLSDGRPLGPRPAQPHGPPIMLGGDANRALERVAARADIYFGDANFDYRAIVPKWHRFLDIVGDRLVPAMVLGTHLWVVDDDAIWDDVLAPAIAYQLSRYWQWTFDEADRPTKDIRPEDLDRDCFLVGTTDELVEKLGWLYDHVPVDNLCVWGRPPGVTHDLALNNATRLATEVLPALGQRRHNKTGAT